MNRILASFVLSAATLATLASLTACGGGGGSSDGSAATASGTSTATGTTTPATTSTSTTSSTATDPAAPTPPQATVASTTGTASGVSFSTGASLTVAQSGSGHTYYVATNGSDSAAGSSAAPFATLSRALNSAGAGDTVIVNGGSYYWPSGVWISKNASASNWLVIKAAAGQTVNITGNYGDGNAVGYCIGVAGSYVEVRGLTCSNFYNTGFFVYGGHHLRFDGNTATNLGGAGFAVYQNGAAPNGTQVELLGNTVSLVSLRYKGATMSGGWSAGIFVSASQATVASNTVSNVYGEGIILAGPQIWAAANLVHDVCAVDIYLDTASQALVEANLMYTTTPTTAFASTCMKTDGVHPLTPNGIQAAAEVATYTTQAFTVLSQVIIRNNIVIGARVPFWYGNYGTGAAMSHWRVIGNSFVGGTAQFVQLAAAASGTHSDVIFANNIFHWPSSFGAAPATANLVSIGNATGLYFWNNLWYPGAPSNVGGTGVGNVVADPQFAGGGVAATSYKLQASSPAMHAGTATYEPPVDYFGAARSSMNLGAANSM